MLAPAFDPVRNVSEPRRATKKNENENEALLSTNAEKDSGERSGTENDGTLIALAEDHFDEDRLLAAARALRMVKDKRLLKKDHKDILTNARLCEALVAELKSPISDGWTKQGESHEGWDSIIYFRMDQETNTKLTVRVETPIELSLLVPLLSVLNETELYPTWLPSWEKPRLGLTRAEKLQQTGRASQMLLLEADMPWPLCPREAAIAALAFDDIEESGDIFVLLHSLSEGEGIAIPPPQDGTRRTRVDFEGGFLFCKCPHDHPALQITQMSTTGMHAKDMVLVCFSAYVDAKVQFLPQSVINFVARTVIGRMWTKFLKVADDVKRGKRPEHLEAIAKKREVLYNWVDIRVRSMLESMKLKDSSSSATTSVLDEHPENWF